MFFWNSLASLMIQRMLAIQHTTLHFVCVYVQFCILRPLLKYMTKVCIVKAMVFPVVIYRCESWAIKKAEHERLDAFQLWCWRRRESPLDCKEIKPVNAKRNKPWIFRKTGAEALVLWPPDAKSRLTGKDPDAGKDWRQEKGVTEDETVG